MKNPIVEIQGSELESFKKAVENDSGVRSMLDELVKFEKVHSTEYRILKAKKSQLDGINAAFMVMGLNEDRTKIIVIEKDHRYDVLSSIIEEENGLPTIKGYALENNQIKNIFTLNYDDKLKEAIKKMDEFEVKEPLNKDQVLGDLPCIYGNWCGPGCSGPGDPISPVDACCRFHDYCYTAFGYFSCTCDEALINCLKPYVAQGSEWAILVTWYFENSPCIP